MENEQKVHWGHALTALRGWEFANLLGYTKVHFKLVKLA